MSKGTDVKNKEDLFVANLNYKTNDKHIVAENTQNKLNLLRLKA